MTTNTVLAPFLKQGYVYLRPALDESGEILWTALYEVEVGGTWHQDRASDADPEVALTQCLQGEGGIGILGKPFSFQSLVDWSDYLQEEAEVPTVTPPRDWHLPTRANSFKNSKLPLTELLKGVRCHWCNRERNLEDLTLDWNLEFMCLTDTKNCIHPATKKPSTEAPANAAFVQAGAPIENGNGNGHAKSRSTKSRAKAADTEIKEAKEGRVFVCQTEKGGCGKKKRTTKVKGRLPELCSACREKKEAGK